MRDVAIKYCLYRYAPAGLVRATRSCSHSSPIRSASFFSFAFSTSDESQS